jgi:peptidoglycan/LPS O-acetylase OafA/YrhL
MADFQDRAAGRDNNFNLCRMLAATAVLVSHAYALSLGGSSSEPLANTLGMSLGELAVIGFFVISGFFISQSFERKRSFMDFWIARVLRIYPGLIAVLLLSVFLLGPSLTSWSTGNYFFDSATFTYLPYNLSLRFLQWGLPGVFENNPYPSVINGSLWTLFYEVACYGLVALVGVLGISTRRFYFVAFLVVYSIGYFFLKIVAYEVLQRHGMLLIFHQLTLPFVTGMALYHFRSLIPFNGIGCALATVAAFAAFRGAWFREVFILSLCYFLFAFGFLSFATLKFYNRIGDYSYGMYIYAFPIEQTAIAYWPGISALELIAVSFPITLLFSMLSWHMLEKPMLAMRPILTGWLDASSKSKKLLAEVRR